ncbi:Siroheme synthase [compost metagenome]
MDLLSANRTDTGRVTLVGAGPSEAEQLTLKAVRALQAADVILFDDCVSDDVLELARREAKRLLVGERSGRTRCRQKDVNDMMVSLARAGHRVVRLKSGDPMAFDRAGEEIARLHDEGIPVDVVPGITAASATAADLVPGTMPVRFSGAEVPLLALAQGYPDRFPQFLSGDGLVQNENATCADLLEA